jgi:hypothetical protein
MTATVVHRLSVRRRAGLEPDAARAVAQRLAALDVAPASLGPSAVLCIRSLADPAPGTLRLEDDAWAASPWVAALERRVDALGRHAARPADGPVPAGVEAVLFRDRVELLACLAEAAATPGAMTSWWWRTLTRELGGDIAIAWLREPALVPAVVDLLARRGTVAAVLTGLPAAAATRIAAAVAAEAGLTAVARAVTQPGPVDGPPITPPTAARAAPSTRRALVVGAAAARVDRQIGALTDPAVMPPAAAALAVVALAVHRRSVLLHDPGFAPAVRRLAAGVLVAPGGVQPAPVGDDGAGVPETAAQIAAPPIRGVDRAAGAHRREAGSPTSAADPRPAVGGARRDETVGPDAPSPRHSGPEPAAAERKAADPPGDAIVTDLGGLFFLLVIAVSLDLYTDFTRPLGPQLRLDPWDLLTLLGEELGAREAAPGDAIWPLFAWLADRPPDARPGMDWRPPASWRLPPDWLRPFPAPHACRWARVDARVRVEHPAGFAVLDARSPADRPADVRRLLRAGPGSVVLRRGAVRRPHRARAQERWVAELAGYLRARLRDTLGAGDDGAIRCVLLERRAQVFLGPGSCDVVMALDELPVAVRAAGLDRDLGWVPAARRSVRFRYR